MRLWGRSLWLNPLSNKSSDIKTEYGDCDGDQNDKNKQDDNDGYDNDNDIVEMDCLWRMFTDHNNLPSLLRYGIAALSSECNL